MSDPSADHPGAAPDEHGLVLVIDGIEQSHLGAPGAPPRHVSHRWMLAASLAVAREKLGFGAVNTGLRVEAKPDIEPLSLAELERRVVGIRPALTLLLDVPVEVGLAGGSRFGMGMAQQDQFTHRGFPWRRGCSRRSEAGIKAGARTAAESAPPALPLKTPPRLPLARDVKPCRTCGPRSGVTLNVWRTSAPLRSCSRVRAAHWQQR